MPDGDAGIGPAEWASFKTSLDAVSGNVRQFAEDVGKKFKASETLSEELKAKIDKSLTEASESRQQLISEFSDKLEAANRLAETQTVQIHDLEQKISRGVTSPVVLDYDGKEIDLRSPGRQFITSEGFKNLQAAQASGARFRGRYSQPMAAITTGSAGATRDVLVPYDRQAGIIIPPNRRMTIRDLLTPGRTSQNAIQYTREVGFSNAAATVSEGAIKPESDIDYELKTVSVTTIAHFIVASNQIIDDAPQLESQIDGRLRYGLSFVEEIQLLHGPGTGTDINGICTQASPFSRAFTPELPTRIDDIRLAVLQTELAYLPASGIVLHPTDWARIETTKDTQGKYLVTSSTDGQGNASFRLWGLPVVSTQAMIATRFLVGAFQLGAQIFDRQDAAVELSTEDSDNFRRNLVTIRAEERLAMAVYRPQAFVYGTFMPGT
jgi:HK97 family phage major capsid protein